MITVGDKLPKFSSDAYLPKIDELKKLDLDDFKGRWLILLFYPADFTFVCPTELEDAAKKYSDFIKNGAEIISVSTDTAFVHKAWHDNSEAISKVEYPMLADPTGKLCKDLGVYIEKEGVARRSTFIINPDQDIVAIDIHDNSIGRSIGEIYRKFEASKFVYDNDGAVVCPASWQPGDKTLKPGIDLVGKI